MNIVTNGLVGQGGLSLDKEKPYHHQEDLHFIRISCSASGLDVGGRNLGLWESLKQCCV